MRLAAKKALITAAGAGIGRAAAVMFAREGAEVWAADIDEAALAALLAEAPGVVTRVLDVRDEGAVARVCAEMGRCDALFNCAGAVTGGTALATTDDQHCAAFEINVLSMARLIRAVLPAMIEARAGAIVNMSSVASSVTGVAERCAYGVTKAAVIGLTKSVAADFVSAGVRCNAICPGTVDTPSLRARIAAQSDPEAAMSAFIARQPMGRFGRAEEIAALAAYLASDEAAFVTGQTFVIDGGWTI